MAKQLKKKVEVTREEWGKAQDRWASILRSGPFRTTDLTERQFGLLNQLETNGIKSLNGLAVMISRNTDGSILNNFPFRGMILNVKQHLNEYIFTVLFYPSDHESWDGERIEEIKIFQLDQVQDIYLLVGDQLKDMKLVQLINTINRSRKQNVLLLEARRKYYVQVINTKEKEITKLKSDVNSIEQQIKSAQIPDLSREEITNLFNLLRKNKRVENAFINTAGEMIVETKMLYPTTPLKMSENKKKPIGRFVFKLTTRGISSCQFINLDYCFHKSGSSNHYPHPNISGTNICSGSNGVQLENMSKAGNFYELVDLLLLFFSLFPHDDGSPHVSHETWISSRFPEPKENPWETSERLWELYPGKKTNMPKKEEYLESQLNELAKYAHAGRSSSTLSLSDILAGMSGIDSDPITSLETDEHKRRYLTRLRVRDSEGQDTQQESQRRDGEERSPF